MTDLAEFGLNVPCLPWLFVCGSRNTLPWAAEVFDRGRRLAGSAQPSRKRAGGKDIGGYDPGLPDKARIMLRVIRAYEVRVRKVSLRAALYARQ